MYRLTKLTKGGTVSLELERPYCPGHAVLDWGGHENMEMRTESSASYINQRDLWLLNCGLLDAGNGF